MLLISIGPTDCGSHVFACFINFFKAFNKVSHWELLAFYEMITFLFILSLC